MKSAVIPYNYEIWHHCITVDCDLELTPDYIEERISSLQDTNNFRTKQFVKLYGDQHRENVLSWFKQAQNTL